MTQNQENLPPFEFNDDLVIVEAGTLWSVFSMVQQRMLFGVETWVGAAFVSEILQIKLRPSDFGDFSDSCDWKDVVPKLDAVTGMFPLVVERLKDRLTGLRYAYSNNDVVLNSLQRLEWAADPSTVPRADAGNGRTNRRTLRVNRNQNAKPGV